MFVGAGLALGLSAIIGIVLFVTVGSFNEPYEQLFEGLTTALIIPAVVLTGFILGGRSDSMTITVAFAVACLVGGSAYAVAFMALSVFTSRAFLLELAYVLI